MIEAIWVKKSEWRQNTNQYLPKMPLIVYDARTEKPEFVVLPPIEGILEALTLPDGGEKDGKE